MKYVDEFRDGVLAKCLARAIHDAVDPSRRYRLMEFCGGHTHTLSRYGIEDLLPDNIRMVHGPGCPVCVLPIARLESAIRLAGRRGVTLCTYADLLRVPVAKGDSLLKAKARGADIRMVYSVADVLEFARGNPGREVVFLAVGFETTTPPTAVAIIEAKSERIGNFSVLCNHVLTPSAMQAILESSAVGTPETLGIDGFVGPAHVSTIIGTRPYERIAEAYRRPVVVAGFEPLDVMYAVLMLVRQLNDGRAVVENQFTRAVSREGNLKAQRLVAEVFERRQAFEWRGLGIVPKSALAIKRDYRDQDAEHRFDVEVAPIRDPKACECAAILRGVKQPIDCKVFGTVCTPDTPIGSCMVSSEGACAAHYTYGRHRDRCRSA